MEVKETKTASTVEVLEILGKGKAEHTYEQQLAYDHAKKSALSDAKVKKMRKALDDLEILSDSSKITIIDVMPKNQMTLRQILAHERKSFSDEEINKILAIVKEKS
jgi:DNA-directed RNA polymerase subunit F